MKTVVSILGATASGKSSLSRVLLGNEAKEYYATIGGERIRVTFGADGFALAGG
jgi:Fe-S cluster assembly ATPase SufC